MDEQCPFIQKIKHILVIIKYRKKSIDIHKSEINGNNFPHLFKLRNNFFTN